MSTIKQIFYKRRRNEKWTLHKPLEVQTTILPETLIRFESLTLHTDGLFCIALPYSWDGATWCPDVPWVMRGSAFHDGFYQLFREELLDPRVWRQAADQLLYECCLEDGRATTTNLAVIAYRTALAKTIYAAVRKGAASAAKPDVLVAP